MNNEELIDVKTLRPFRRFIYTIGALPSSYLISMTYEEQLIWFCNYLEKTVIPAIDNNGLAVEELQAKYIELKDYVDHYFDNLDVQEEINNKLDDMAESGELAEIIAQYLQVSCVLAYDTINDLQNADNIINGSITMTLGRNSYNDGLTMFYKIRPITSGDIVDNINIVSLNISDTLIAERIDESFENIKTNPLFYGADLSGTIDSSTAFNNCINNNKGGTINLTTGTYLINDTINLPFSDSEKVSINGNGSKIITTATLTNLFNYGYNRSDNEMNNVGYMSYIKDLDINCSGGNITNVIKTAQAFKDLHILNIKTYRTLNGIVIGDSNSNPSDVLIDGCIIYGNGSEYNGVGIITNGTDCNINNTRIYGFRIGMRLFGGARVFKTQVLLRWEEQTSTNFDPYERNGSEFNEYYPLTKFADCQFTSIFDDCYCDSMYQFIHCNTNQTITLTNSFYFNSRSNTDCSIIKIGSNNAKLTISNCQFSISKNTLGQVIDRTNILLTNYSQININNIIIDNENNLTDETDLILNAVPVYHNALNLTADTWYLLKIIGNVPENNRMNEKIWINGYEYTIYVGMSGTTISPIQQNKGTGDSVWTLGYLYKNGNIYVCIKCSTDNNGVKMNLKTTYSNNYSLDLTPSKNARFPEASRLLSDYINETPSTTLLLKNVLF